MKQFVEHIFPAQSLQKWATAAAKELEKNTSMESLRVKKDGLEWEPYCSSDKLECWHVARLHASSENFAGPRHWINMPKILVEDVSQSNALALEHLQHGAEGIVFDLPSDFSNVAQLLNDIQLPHCAVHFLVKAHADAFFSALQKWLPQKFPNAKINLTIFWKDKPKLSEILSFQNAIGFRGAGIVVQRNEIAEDQIAYALLEGVNRVEQLKVLGLSDEAAIKHISFSVQLDADFFLEIVKLRVMRTLWSAVVSAYKVENTSPLFLHAVSDARMNAAFQPHGNLIKETYAAMAAILGGCDGLTLEPEDDSNTNMVRMARNTSLILREESFFSLVADPLAGSYLIEQLTKQLAQASWKKFQILSLL